MDLNELLHTSIWDIGFNSCFIARYFPVTSFHICSIFCFNLCFLYFLYSKHTTLCFVYPKYTSCLDLSIKLLSISFSGMALYQICSWNSFPLRTNDSQVFLSLFIFFIIFIKMNITHLYLSLLLNHENV
jgi:hypothetical protein